MSLFDTLFSDEGADAAKKAGEARQRGLKNQRREIESASPIYAAGLDRSVGHVDAATALAEGRLSDAITPFDDIYGGDVRARDMYLNSLGLNGEAGSDAAMGAFRAGPGYEFTRDQGLEAINRRRNAGGMLTSGNADIDAIKFGTGLADQEYGGWQDRLSGFDPNRSAASRANVLTQLAELFRGAGSAKAGLSSQETADQAALRFKVGDNRANVGMSEGQTFQDVYQANASRDGALLNALLAAGGVGAYAYGKS